MTRTRDLFAGYTVQVLFRDETWAVVLSRPDGGTESATTHARHDDALQAVEAWMRLMTDDTELDGTDRAIWAILRAAAARKAAAQPSAQPAEDEALELDRQRAWFERQMGEGG